MCNYRKHGYLVLLLWICLSSLWAIAGDRPNLVIICTDEHNFRTLGCYRDLLSEDQAFVWGRGVAVETPHIDSLADEGALFTSFYGTTPLCAPARASLMTGLYPHATGVPVNHVSLTVFIDYHNCLRCGFGGTFNKMM